MDERKDFKGSSQPCGDQYDKLTGLPKKHLFAHLVNQAVSRAKRHDRIVALMVLRASSIDSLQPNELQNQFHKLVARRLLSCIRETDTLARLDNDEFAILFDEIQHPNEVHLIASKLLSKIIH